MNLIAAVDRNWGIGKNNRLLVEIPMDQKYFRDMTQGKVIVAGRKTFEGFCGGRPLFGRTNVILSRRSDYSVKGAVVVHSLDELHRKLASYKSEDIFVIGGQTIYEQLLDECDVAHITKLNYAYDADRYFPNLDERPQWRLTGDSEEQTYFNVEFYFCRYERIPQQP